MTAVLKSKTLSVAINCDPKKLYEFVSKPENLPKWAKMFCRSIKKSKGGWVVETPQGPANVRFSKKNDFGILDHYVSPAPGVEVFVPMRVVPNASGSEVLLTLFQAAGMSDEKHAEDIGWVRQDLRTLKDIMERRKRA
ncbi:MAG: SRPBCC family protein [Candidatus Methylomirabilales bacterium]